MQYCTLAPIILRKVDNINFAPYTFFDIFIKCNKSPKAMSSLRSTVRKLKIYTRHPPPGLSRDLYALANLCGAYRGKGGLSSAIYVYIPSHSQQIPWFLIPHLC